MRTFIAGAIKTLVSVARIRVLARSFAWPVAVLAIKSALAGTTIIKSELRDNSMWPISASSVKSNNLLYTFSWASAETDIGVTKFSAALVITGIISAPFSFSFLTNSKDL